MTTSTDRDEEPGGSQFDRAVRHAARKFLEPGEGMRGVTEVREAFGDPGPVADSEPVTVKSPRWFDRVWTFGTSSLPRKIVFFALLAPLLLFVALDGLGPGTALLDRWVGGRVCQGPRGSLARRVQHALNVLGPGANYAVVSDRRLLLVRHEPFARPASVTPVLELALTDIASARHAPRGLLRRRVELRFTDGSRIVLALAAFSALSPRRFLAALSRPAR